jgi:hypothetical protein
MKEFKITEEQIKEIANVPDWLGSMARMKEWFPAAFGPEWEEVPLSGFDLVLGAGGTQWELSEKHGLSCPFLIVENQYSRYRGCFKIEDGKIYRRKRK